jgi:hypothetical protein
VAVALFVTLATLVAVTRYWPPVVGAVYLTDVDVAELKVPQAVPEHEEPDTVQVTPCPDVSFSTVAVSVTDCDSVIPYVCGVTATVICACGSGAGEAILGVGIPLAPLAAEVCPISGNAEMAGKMAANNATRPTENCLAPYRLLIRPPKSLAEDQENRAQQRQKAV